MIASAVVTRDLVKKRGKRRALDGLALSVPRGSILGLVGENGAGKTTWMMTVAGLLSPDSGEIDILGYGPFDAVHHSGRIALLPQDSELPLEMTPFDALYRFSRIQGVCAEEARKSAREILGILNLAERADLAVRTLSHGMRKRAMVAQCFVGNPEIVLLDEPLNGLDPLEADRLRKFILSQRGRRTIVVSSHNLEDVERLCTHVAVISKGRLVKMDTIASFTHGSDRIAYGLAGMPRDIEALKAIVPGASFDWCSDKNTLICSLDSFGGGVALANRLLLPVLLEETDILSVTQGQSLEEAFLLSGQSHPERKF
jgi:ABC-type multidrug transport system ATPase subunit